MVSLKNVGILLAHKLLAAQEACCSMTFNTCGSNITFCLQSNRKKIFLTYYCSSSSKHSMHHSAVIHKYTGCVLISYLASAVTSKKKNLLETQQINV
jgi:hypothetical protein